MQVRERARTCAQTYPQFMSKLPLNDRPDTSATGMTLRRNMLSASPNRGTPGYDRPSGVRRAAGGHDPQSGAGNGSRTALTGGRRWRARQGLLRRVGLDRARPDVTSPAARYGLAFRPTVMWTIRKLDWQAAERIKATRGPLA